MKGERVTALLCISIIIARLYAMEENGDQEVNDPLEEIKESKESEPTDEDIQKEASETVTRKTPAPKSKERDRKGNATDDPAKGSNAFPMCPSYPQYIYHGGKDGEVHLDCGYQSSFINASTYAVCDVSKESFNILDLPICPTTKSFVILTTNDTARLDKGQPSGYAAQVPDLEYTRDAVEKYFRNHAWVLAVDDGVKLVCGNYTYILREGQIARCFGHLLDHNQFIYDFGRFVLGKKGQTFFYYTYVNNSTLSQEQQQLVDIIMNIENVTFAKTWYISASEGFMINCAGIMKGSVFDHSLIKQEWKFIDYNKYARCNGNEILIDLPRYGDTVWVIMAGMYVQGREKIILHNPEEPVFGHPTYVTAKDNLQIACGSYYYHPKQNEILSCDLLHLLRTGEKIRIIEGIEGVIYHFPTEIYIGDAEDFFKDPDDYYSLDVVNAGEHFGVKEEARFQFIHVDIPEKDIAAFKNASLKNGDENIARLKYFANQEIIWKQI